METQAKKQTEVEILEQKLKEAKAKEKLKTKANDDKKAMMLGKLLLKKVKEKPEYAEKINGLIEEYASQKEKTFLEKLKTGGRLY